MLQLLSPAGDWDCLHVAVYNGADAVYFGLPFFNARRLANNFQISDLPNVVFFCHVHHVKTYLALNTLVRNEELPMWFKTLEQAYLAGIDGVIIQEVSFLPLIKKYFPELEVHASTQASLMNYHGINQFNFDTVILARELSVEQIHDIRKNTKTKLEMFVHGHLCVSYSGQCLISSLIGKRSGNRGLCASSCRKPYNNSGYLLSPKDLMLAEKIDEIAQLGINSVKIEGRMKSPEYVGITTKTYRQQIDSLEQHHFKFLSKEQLDNLSLGFNREFTTGFFGGNKSIIGKDMPMNRGIYLGTVNYGRLILEHPLSINDGVGFWHPAFEGKLPGGLVTKIFIREQEVSQARKGEIITLPSAYFRNQAQVFLTSQNYGKDILNPPRNQIFPLTITAELNKPLTFQYRNIIASSPIPLQESKNQSLTLEQIKKELQKSLIVGIEWQITTSMMDSNLFLPKSFLRQTRESLEQQLREQYLPPRTSHLTALPEIPEHAPQIEPRMIVKVYSIQQLQEAQELGVYAIYFDIFHSQVEEAAKLCTKTKLFLDTPVVLSDEDIEKIEKTVKHLNPPGIVISNLGLLGTDFPGEKHGKYSLNIFNDLDVEMLHRKKIIPCISVELNAKQALNMKNKEFIYYTHGRIPVMHLKGYYTVKALTDEKEYTFPLRQVHGNTEMLYSRSLALLDSIKPLIQGGIRYFFLDLEKDTTTITKAYQNIIAGKRQDISMLKKGTTLGNYNKGVA